MSRSSTPDTQIYRPVTPDDLSKSIPIERPLQFLPRRAFQRQSSAESYSTIGSFHFDDTSPRPAQSAQSLRKDSSDFEAKYRSRLQAYLRPATTRRASTDSVSLDDRLDHEQPTRQQPITIAQSPKSPRRRGSAESFQTTGSFALDERAARNWEIKNGWKDVHHSRPPVPKLPDSPEKGPRNFSRPFVRPAQTPQPLERRQTEPVRILPTPIPPSPSPSPPHSPLVPQPQSQSNNSSSDTTWRSSLASDSEDDDDSSSGSSASSVVLRPEEYLGHAYKSEAFSSQPPFVPPPAVAERRGSGAELSRITSPPDPQKKTVRFHDSVTARPDLISPRPEAASARLEASATQAGSKEPQAESNDLQKVASQPRLAPSALHGNSDQPVSRLPPSILRRSSFGVQQPPAFQQSSATAKPDQPVSKLPPSILRTSSSTLQQTPTIQQTPAPLELAVAKPDQTPSRLPPSILRPSSSGSQQSPTMQQTSTSQQPSASANLATANPEEPASRPVIYRPSSSGFQQFPIMQQHSTTQQPSAAAKPDQPVSRLPPSIFRPPSLGSQQLPAIQEIPAAEHPPAPPNQQIPPTLTSRSSFPPPSPQRPPQPRKQVSFEHNRAPPPSLLEQAIAEVIMEEPAREAAAEADDSAGRPSTSSTTASIPSNSSLKALSMRSTRSTNTLASAGGASSVADSEASLSTQAIAEVFRASNYDISSLTPKQLEKLKKKGVDPALWLEMRAATTRSVIEKEKDNEIVTRERVMAELAKEKERKEEKAKGKKGRFKFGRPLVGNSFIG